MYFGTFTPKIGSELHNGLVDNLNWYIAIMIHFYIKLKIKRKVL